MKIKLKPCRRCGGTNIVIERWSSGGPMFMVKCNNPDCPVPEDGFPVGRNPDVVKEDWNRRQATEDLKGTGLGCGDSRAMEADNWCGR